MPTYSNAQAKVKKWLGLKILKISEFNLSIVKISNFQKPSLLLDSLDSGECFLPGYENFQKFLKKSFRNFFTNLSYLYN